MVYEVGDIVKLKKPHPCGSYEWEILRVGADFRFKVHGLRAYGHGDEAAGGEEHAGASEAGLAEKNTAKSRETACIFPAFLL